MGSATGVFVGVMTDGEWSTCQQRAMLQHNTSMSAFAGIQLASNEIFNSFDGKITITGVDENGYEWQSEKIPAGVCAKLVDEARSLNTFEEVQIGSSTLQYSASQSNDFTQACETAAGTNDSLTVTWIKSTS